MSMSALTSGHRERSRGSLPLESISLLTVFSLSVFTGPQCGPHTVSAAGLPPILYHRQDPWPAISRRQGAQITARELASLSIGHSLAIMYALTPTVWNSHVFEAACQRRNFCRPPDCGSRRAHQAPRPAENTRVR